MNFIHPLLSSKYGCWVTLPSRKLFSSKLEALRAASQTNESVYFYYHDHIWENFDRTLLGKIPLTTLYKERAQQLRDKYSHLILHYSGGADSHNILYTFLTNNIKLDEISVRWPKPLRDGKFYTPNTKDTSARNAASEWDFAIKPTLDWLASNRPDIKITITDYASNLTQNLTSVEYIESRILSMNVNRGGFATLAMWVDPATEINISQTTVSNTAHIFGIDKPILIVKDNNICVQFMDAVFENSLLPNGKPEEKVETFYWSPDFPILALEQAYQSALSFKHSKELISLIEQSTTLTPSDMLKRFESQGNVQKKILYKDSWNINTFQAGKPNVARSDWYFWLYENKELEPLRNNWTQAFNNLIEGIDQRLLLTASFENLSIPSIRPVRTKPFPILSLNSQ
jgi:hypothetical protein